jgi:molybdenum ABC transporter molybdate-binding protein
VLWFAGSVLLMAAMLVSLFLPERRPEGVTLACAAALRQPVEEAIAAYRAEHGGDVRVQYGGSNTLLGQIEVSGVGDLYLPADDSYLKLARTKGLIEEVLPLAQMRAVVGVRRGNPKQLHSLDDLLRSDVRLVLANPDQAAIGSRVREALQHTGKWDAVQRHVRDNGVFKPTVSDSANDILLGSVDAGFLWDAVAAQYPEIEVVQLPELAEARANVGVGRLTGAKHPAAAEHFARYLAASDRGLRVLWAQGYQTVEGQPWAETPRPTTE